MKSTLAGVAMLFPVSIALTTALYFAELFWYLFVPTAVYGIYRLEKKWGTWQVRNYKHKASRSVVPLSRKIKI